MEQLSWRQVLNLVESARTSSQKCAVRVLDTVFIDGANSNAIAWYFTTKNGTISKKKKDKCSLAAVCDRFSRFSLANPHNAEGIVCAVISGDGTRKYLKQEEMNDFVNNRIGDLLEDSFLQVYLRPYEGNAQVVRAVCTVESSGRNTVTVTAQGIVGARGGCEEDASDLQTEANDQAKYFCHELTNFFKNDVSDLVLKEVEIECVLDDNKHLWLSRIPKCFIAQKNAENDIAINSVLPELGKQASNSNLSSRGSARSTSPRAQSTEGARGGQRTLSAANSSSSLSKLLSRIEGGAVHSCAKGPEDLPGLRSWIVDSMDQDGNVSGGKPNLKWFVDLSLYNGSGSPNPNSATIYDQRASVRKSVPHSLLSLLRLSEPLLLGAEHIDSAADFVGRWKHVFEAWLASQNVVNKITRTESGTICALNDEQMDAILKQANEVTVDGNCHAVCQKLESLVESGFNDSPQSPHNNTADSRGASAGVAERAVKTDSAAVVVATRHGEVVDRRQVSSAGNDGGAMGEPSEAPPLQPYEHSWDHTDNVSLVSSIGDGSVITSSKKKFSIDEAPHYKVYRSSDSPQGVPNRAGKKPSIPVRAKKKKLPIKQPPTEHPIADMDMIAKFAAAKEMEQQRMRDHLENDHSDTHDYSTRVPFGVTENHLEEDSPRRDDPYGSDAVYLKNQKRRKEFQHQSVQKGQHKKAGSKGQRALDIDRRRNFEHDDNPHYPNSLQDPNAMSYTGAVSPSPQWSQVNGAAENASVTGSEANFMMRHAKSGDFSQFDNDDLDDGASLSVTGSTRNDAGAENGRLAAKLSATMREKVGSLEDQIQNLITRLGNKDVELQKSEEKYKKLYAEKVTLVNANNKEISRLRDENERELLKMKSQYAVNLSTLVKDPAALEAAANELSPQVNNDVGSTNKSNMSRQESTIQATSALIQQLDDMRSELKYQADNFSTERKQYTAEHSLKLISVEKSFKIEIQEQKALSAALEDKLKDTEDALAESRAQAKTANMLCAQLEAKYRDSVEVQTKLKNDLKIMQASVGNTYKLESAQEIGVGVDADTAIRLAEAKSEAKIRQIQIKCDFMRSQLEAEHAAQEQLNHSIVNQRKEYDQLKNDFRTRVREMETEKQQAVEDAERQTELQYEERMVELSALQSKFHMLQGQLQDAFQDNSMSKQREEAAKANALKAQTQQANLRAELSNAKAAIEELRAQKEEGSVKESTNQSNEAMLRRLDNERTYLKSQLSSEMTHKNELQNALRQCQQQLADQQRQWSSDVDTLKANLSRQEEEATLLDQKLSLKISALEGEESRLKAQNGELREGFKKMRDQLRVEELNMENTRTANRRLIEEVEANRIDLARLKQAEESANILSQQQASLMSGSLSALEEKATAEAAHLRSELSKQYVINAESQRELLDMKSFFEAERVKFDQKILAGRMFHSLRHMYKNRVAMTFRLWHTQSTLLNAAGQFKETMKKALARTQAEDKKDAEEALAQLRDKLTEEWEDRMAESDKQHEERLNGALEEADAQRVLSLENLREEMESILRARESEWMHKHEDAEGWTRKLLEEEEKKKEKLISLYDKRAEEEGKRRDEEEAERIASAKAFTLAEAEKHWGEVRDQRDLEFQVHMEQAIRTVEEAHLNKIKAMKAKHVQDQADALAELRDMHNMELSAVEKKHAEDQEIMHGVHQDEIHDLLGAAQVKHEDAMADLKTDMDRAHENRIRQLREAWESELQSKLEEHEVRMTQEFNEKAEKMDNSVESERKKAEALEAAKWRQALKDAEKRYKLDLQQVRAQAWSERDQEAKLELAGVHADNSRSLQSVMDKQKEILEETKLSFGSEIDKLKSRFETEKEEAVRLSVQNATTELNEKWDQEFSVKLTAAEKNAQLQWSLKYNKEKELTEKLRGEIAKQTQLHAEERNTLQDKINGNDEILGRLKDDHDYEVKRLQRDHERALDNLDIRFQNAKKAWLEEEKKREEEEMANAKAAWEVETKQRVQQVRTDMETEMELEMQKVKEESDQLVTGLETAMDNVRVEKNALLEDLERASERLEELEDAQFDLQQELKLKNKEMSFAIWKISCGAMNMKIEFKRVMEDTQSKMTNILDSTKESLMKRVEKVTLLAMRLSELLAENETSRTSMHEALTLYKSNVLTEKRAQIRMAELELDRLASDREVMEEERDSLLDQIGGRGGLESQVEEVEEQMREHTNSSTVMQNGRINVAHAKKKKRLDNEMERLLELIEEKKSQVSSLEKRSDGVQLRREEKEVVLIDLEKELVQVLIEQQRLVLNLVEGGKLTGDKAKHVAQQYNFPWPPIEHPSLDNAKELIASIGESG